MASKSHGKKYGHGRIRRTTYGTYAADLSLGRLGGRVRRTFKTRAAAEAWIDAQSASDAPPLTSSQLRDAAEAFALLPPGTSLAAFVRERGYCGKVSEAASGELAALAAVYLGECRTRLRADAFSRAHAMVPAALASPILGEDLLRHTPTGVRDYLNTIRSPHTRRHVKGALSSFYKWLIAQGKMGDNPTEGVSVPKPPPSAPPAILTLEEAQHLLNVAVGFRDGGLLPYVAICLFAGLRPTEAKRLRLADVRPEYIMLSAEQTKTVAARTVAIRPNLRAILDRCAFPREAVIPCAFSTFHTWLTQFIKATGLNWTQDIMRHSFASYAYEMSRDAAATAYEMGHRGTDIFFRHYRGLVAPGDGEKYFRLMPTVGNFANFSTNSGITC